jgi:hypothetical protein
MKNHAMNVPIPLWNIIQRFESQCRFADREQVIRFLLERLDIVPALDRLSTLLRDYAGSLECQVDVSTDVDATVHDDPCLLVSIAVADKRRGDDLCQAFADAGWCNVNRDLRNLVVLEFIDRFDD